MLSTGTGETHTYEFGSTFSTSAQYNLSCGNEWTIEVYAEDVHIGTIHFKCEDCKGGIGH